MKKTLFQYKDEGLIITITAKFQGKKLLIKGLDMGNEVKQWVGEYDYAYSMTLPEKSVAHLKAVLRLSVNDKGELLETLANTYNDNFCFSRLKTFFKEYGIEHSTKTWA